jgi:hypothetical protein
MDSKECEGGVGSVWGEFFGEDTIYRIYVIRKLKKEVSND